MRLKTKKMLLASLFAAITIICAQIIIPIPATQIQFSMSVFGVLLCGAVLGAKYGVISMLVYILLGACGMPVFGKFLGGIGVLLGPSGGYIASYPIMTLVIGSLLFKVKKPTFFLLFLSMLASLITCYILGSVWLCFCTKISFGASIMSGVMPFIAFDIFKAILASYLCLVIKKRTKSDIS